MFSYFGSSVPLPNHSHQQLLTSIADHWRAGAVRWSESVWQEQGTPDKRRKVRARLGEIDGVPVVWLTASGHQASGKSRGFEVRPTSDSLGHALGPSRLSKWIEPLTPTLAPYGIEFSVTWGPSC